MFRHQNFENWTKIEGVMALTIKISWIACQSQELTRPDALLGDNEDDQSISYDTTLYQGSRSWSPSSSMLGWEQRGSFLDRLGTMGHIETNLQVMAGRFRRMRSWVMEGWRDMLRVWRLESEWPWHPATGSLIPRQSLAREQVSAGATRGLLMLAYNGCTLRERVLLL